MKYIVDFHNDAPDSEISKYLVDNGCTVLKEWNNFDKVYLVETSSEPPTASIVAHVVDDSNTLAMKPLDIEINQHYCRFNPNYPILDIDTADQKDWWKNFCLSKPVFDQPSTQISKKGSHVHVYIMDSGIKADHPEFVNTDISYLYSVTPGDYSDNKGHGTALASIIAGSTCGISSAKLKIVKIFDPSHQTLQSEFLDALDAILADNPPNSFAVLNASWSIPRNPWVEYKLKELMEDGVWTIAAAGNSGHAIEDVTPAAMPEAFTVGSYNQDLKPSNFSDYTGESAISYTQNSVNGGILNAWAPGEFIWAAKLDGTYGYTAGTSMACAVTAAVVAYNLSDFCYSDGTMLEDSNILYEVGPDAYVAWIAFRKDLLDLSDPKYINSVNLIVTLGEAPDILACPDETSTSIKAGTKQNLTLLYNPHETQSIEIISDWPTWAKILPSGAVFADCPLEDAPAPNETFKLYPAKVKRILTSGVEEIINYDIYVVHNNYKPTDLPNDHVINITFLSSCTNFPGTACQLYYNPPCPNICPSGFCCGSGKTFSCFCQGFNAFGIENL